jgi:hypothetical protein
VYIAFLYFLFLAESKTKRFLLTYAVLFLRNQARCMRPALNAKPNSPEKALKERGGVVGRTFFLRSDKTSTLARASIVDGWIYKILWAQNKKAHFLSPRALFTLRKRHFYSKALSAKITAASSQHKHTDCRWSRMNIT